MKIATGKSPLRDAINDFSPASPKSKTGREPSGLPPRFFISCRLTSTYGTAIKPTRWTADSQKCSSGLAFIPNWSATARVSAIPAINSAALSATSLAFSASLRLVGALGLAGFLDGFDHNGDFLSPPTLWEVIHVDEVVMTLIIVYGHRNDRGSGSQDVHTKLVRPSARHLA